MDLKDFIAIKGKSDLFRIMSKTPKGIIVETLNETKAKFKIQPNLQVLILQDITIFSNDNTDLFLKDVFLSIYKRDGLTINTSLKDDPILLKQFFSEIVPNHDQEKVYISDIKKIIKWYSILAQWYPEVIENLAKEEEKPEETTTDTTVEDDKVEEISPALEPAPQTEEILNAKPKRPIPKTPKRDTAKPTKTIKKGSNK